MASLVSGPMGTVGLSAAVFGLKKPRGDLIHRYVRWQQAKRRSGTHAVQNRSDVDRTGKKLVKQKGTGGARHGAASAPQFQGGGRAFGPVPRNHSHDLPKRVRALALKHALSSKVQRSELLVLHEPVPASRKTGLFKRALERLNLTNVLIVTDGKADENLILASRNLTDVDVLPVEGLNVFDILKHHNLALTPEALSRIYERFDRDFPTAAPAWTEVDGKRHRRHREAHSAEKVVRDGAAAGRSAQRQLPPNRSAPKMGSIGIIRALSGSDVGRRRAAMVELLSAYADDALVRQEATSRLLPLLVSANQDEAREAAIALCRLSFPKHYPVPGRRAGPLSEAVLGKIRRDLRELLRREKIDYVAYAEPVAPTPRGDGTVAIAARVSCNLPFEIGGKPAQLEAPAWLLDTREFRIHVSGEAVSSSVVEERKIPARSGDIAAKTVKCHLDPAKPARVILDFFADNPWLQRREVVFTQETPSGP